MNILDKIEDLNKKATDNPDLKVKDLSEDEINTLAIIKAGNAIYS